MLDSVAKHTFCVPWTSNLSRVYPVPCLMKAGTGSISLQPKTEQAIRNEWIRPQDFAFLVLSCSGVFGKILSLLVRNSGHSSDKPVKCCTERCLSKNVPHHLDKTTFDLIHSLIWVLSYLSEDSLFMNGLSLPELVLHPYLEQLLVVPNSFHLRIGGFSALDSGMKLK